MQLRIEIVSSRLLPMIAVPFYSMLLLTPWIVPWGALNYLLGVLVAICSYPFFKQLRQGFKTEFASIELCDNEISAVQLRDGSVYRVRTFEILRLLTFYIEIRLELSTGEKHLCLFSDMTDRATFCYLRRFCKPFFQNKKVSF